MKKIIVLFTILFVACHAFAQEKISGYVEDSLTHNRLTNVSVTLLRKGKPLKFTRSKGDGTFLISIAQKQTGDMLQASYMGYKKQKRRFHQKRNHHQYDFNSFCLEGSTSKRLSHHRAGYHIFRPHPLCQRTR